MGMNANEFLRAFGESFFEPAPLGATAWTNYMAKRIRGVADAKDLRLCTTTGSAIEKSAGEESKHWRCEYLFDFTLYRKEWEDYSLPLVIIEHENQWNSAAFMFDFWKLMIGFAPLRVMFGYAGTQALLEQRIQGIRDNARASAWNYPESVEDLVLLRSPDMDTKTWQILSREGTVWRDRTWTHE